MKIASSQQVQFYNLTAIPLHKNCWEESQITIELGAAAQSAVIYFCERKTTKTVGLTLCQNISTSLHGVIFLAFSCEMLLKSIF